MQFLAWKFKRDNFAYFQTLCSRWLDCNFQSCFLRNVLISKLFLCSPFRQKYSLQTGKWLIVKQVVTTQKKKDVQKLRRNSSVEKKSRKSISVRKKCARAEQSKGRNNWWSFDYYWIHLTQSREEASTHKKSLKTKGKFVTTCSMVHVKPLHEINYVMVSMFQKLFSHWDKNWWKNSQFYAFWQVLLW